jgi:hypothetical protein
LLLAAAVSATGVSTLSSCNGTTGDHLVTFSAFAVGAAGATRPFMVGAYSVQLTTARMHIGAAYFDQSPPSTAFDQPVCIAPGIYAAQLAGPVDVDLLSGQPQEFAVYGNGSADQALSWQLWLMDDAVGRDEISSPNFGPVVTLQGVATRVSDGLELTFAAVVSINDNRLQPVTDPATPGNSPICKQRIVQIGGIDLTFFDGGTLTITIDPRVWFNEQLDLGSLPQVSDDNCQNVGDALIPITGLTYANTPERGTGGATCGLSGLPCCADDAGNPLPGTACQTGYSCNNTVCTAQYCIPNTNFASGTGSQQGIELYKGILTGGPAAYSVTYAH